jgi:hypothetical protein
MEDDSPRQETPMNDRNCFLCGYYAAGAYIGNAIL